MNNLKIYRKKRNIDLFDLSCYVGVSERHLRFIEDGKRMPSLPVAKKIADYLGCTIEDIFYKNLNEVKDEKHS